MLDDSRTNVAISSVPQVAEMYFKKGLPEDYGPDDDIEDLREKEMSAFKFAAFPLRAFFPKEVAGAERSLWSKLSNNLGWCLSFRWERDRKEAVKEFADLPKTMTPRSPVCLRHTSPHAACSTSRSMTCSSDLRPRTKRIAIGHHS